MNPLLRRKRNYAGRYKSIERLPAAKALTAEIEDLISQENEAYNAYHNDFAGIKNWFNEFYARDTRRKIRAVQKAKGEKGLPLTTNVPYGYVKDAGRARSPDS